jgi:Glycosyltransferase family 87
MTQTSIKQRIRVPFVGLHREEWARLGLTALMFLYFTFVILQISSRGLFEYVGIDYRVLFSSAEIARDHGFAAVYDLGFQQEYQISLYNYSFGLGRMKFETVPMPYLPAFVASFLPLLFFQPIVGFILWSIVNTVGLYVYLKRLGNASGRQLSASTVLSLALCLPAFLNIFIGQVNLWLLIAIGEALIAFRKNEELKAGIWLAGLLLKPQSLILIIPGLVLARAFKTVLGFTVVSLVIALLSVLLAGPNGLMRLAGLLLGYTQGLPTNFPNSMMNWRAFGINFEGPIDSTVLWPMMYLGILVTSLIGLSLWLTRPALSSRAFVPVLAGTYAATCTVAWHSHVHMALPLLAPLVFFLADQALPRALKLWLWVPPIIFLGFAFLAGPGYAHSIAGLSVFIINLMVLNWAYREVRRTAHDTKHAVSVGGANATAT